MLGCYTNVRHLSLHNTEVSSLKTRLIPFSFSSVQLVSLTQPRRHPLRFHLSPSKHADDREKHLEEEYRLHSGLLVHYLVI